MRGLIYTISKLDNYPTLKMILKYREHSSIVTDRLSLYQTALFQFLVH